MPLAWGCSGCAIAGRRSHTVEAREVSAVWVVRGNGVYARMHRQLYLCRYVYVGV